MPTSNTELLRLSRKDLEQLVKNVAISKIVGNLFIGEFGEQEVRWADDGCCEVITRYTRGSWADRDQYAYDRRAPSNRKKK